MLRVSNLRRRAPCLAIAVVLHSFLFAYAPLAHPPALADAGVYYVSPCGDDVSTGSSSECGSSLGPFKTIQKAANVAGPGDTVKILPGIYRESVSIPVSGTPEAPITFEAASGQHTAFLYGSENAKSFVWRDEGNGLFSADVSGLARAPELIFELQVPSTALDGWPNYPEITFFREIGDGIIKYPKAHEPDFTVDTPWKYHENWATADGGVAVWDDAAARAQCPATPRDSFLNCMSQKQTENSSLYSVTDQNRDGDGLDLRTYPDLVGSTVFMMDTRSGFYIFRRDVSSFSRNEGRISWNERADFDYMSGIPGVGPFTKYYLEGKREFLDRPMEWFVEGNRLFIRTRTGDSPSNLNIEVAVRERGISFSEQGYLIFRNLDIAFINNALAPENDIHVAEGAMVAFNYYHASDHTTIEGVTIAHGGKGIKFRQPNVNKGLLSHHITIQDSHIYDLEGSAILTRSYSYDNDQQTGAFPYLTIKNNHIHHVGFKPVNNEPAGVALTEAYKVIVTGNYIHDTAHKCLKISKSRGQYLLIKDNYLERCGLNHSEASGIGIWDTDKVYTKNLFMGNVVRGNQGWTYASYTSYWNGGKNYNGINFYQGKSGIGINQDCVVGSVIYRNLFINNAYNGTSGRGAAYNNLIIGSRNGISSGAPWSPETFPSVIQNNLLVDNYYGIYTYPVDVQKPTIDYNLYEQAQSIRDRSDPGLPAGHLVFPKPELTWKAATYGRVCDPADQADSICYNTPWELHGVENDGRGLLADPADLASAPISTLKEKLRLLPGSLAVDTGTLPQEALALIAEMEQALGIEINDEAMQGAAYDIGPFELTTAPTFADVPFDHPFYVDIEALYRAGYTAGCGTDPLRYCPDQTMNRAESSVFVERGIHTASYDPPAPSSQVFADLALDSWAAKWVNGLWVDGYTAGCGTDPLVYCPWQGHTRAEGCVFYLRMLHGANFEPPQPTQQTFVDVPLDTWYAKWVDPASDAGLIEACQTAPELRFCPNEPLTRALAAHMMVQAKGLPLP